MSTANHALAEKLDWLAEYLQQSLDVLSREEAPLVHELLQAAYLEAYRSAAYLYAKSKDVDLNSSSEIEKAPLEKAIDRAAIAGLGH